MKMEHMEVIHISAVDAIRNARKAFDAGELQIQNQEDMEECLYSGPCAIGVSIPTELRSEMDYFTDSRGYRTTASVDQLISSGKITTDDQEALFDLQNAHDSTDTAFFKNTLEQLEISHGLR